MKLMLIAMIPAIVGMKVPDTHPFMKRVDSAATDLIEALKADDVSESAREKWARRAWVIGYFESAYQTDALGDNGKSCGVMQVMTPEKYLTGATCKAVRKDRVLGFRVGIAVLKLLEDKCGTFKKALTAYATDGQCHDWTIPTVEKRCKLIGDCS